MIILAPFRCSRPRLSVPRLHPRPPLQPYRRRHRPHRPLLHAAMQRSFVDSANDPLGPFPLNNLPYAVCKPAPSEPAVVCVGIGDHVLNLSTLATHLPTLFPGPLLPADRAVVVFSTPSLNAFLALGRPTWLEVRHILLDALSSSPNNTALKDAPTSVMSTLILSRSAVTMQLPAHIGDYTDFYSSVSHATNVGTMFRGPENALPASWLHMPIAYHGRSSSVIPSGTTIPRPRGQLKPADGPPVLAASRRLDFELEMAVLIGGPENPLSKPVRLEDAGDRVFGFMLMNDWSARDIQKWEYVPLGPFGAKNFATTISPWVVTLDALLPFAREPQKPRVPVMDYLVGPTNALAHCTFDVNLNVAIQTDAGETPSVVTRSNFTNLYWTVAQQIAHHTVTGCNLRPGDLIASGTISGTERESFGCMLELSWNGKQDIQLENANGATRKFLEDGDSVIITGEAVGDGYRIGFGECVGKVLPPVELA